MDAPETLGEIRKHLDRALKLIDEKQNDYLDARDYYLGEKSEVAATAAVQSIIRRSAKANPLGFAHIPVDALADKVELASLTAPEGRAKALLEQVVDNNDIEDEGDDWVRMACMFGDYYAIIDPEAEDAAGFATADELKVVGSSPLTTIVVYDRKTSRIALFGVKRWEGENKVWHALVYYDDVTIKLVTAPGMPRARAVDFMLDVPPEGDESDAILPHEGGRMLIDHLAIDGKPYGQPVHRMAFGPQDAITKINATNLVNVDGQGAAARWALADPEAELDDDLDADFGTDSPTTSAANKDGLTTATTGTSRVRSIPGSIALLRGIKSVGQFTNTESKQFLDNLVFYIRAMAVATGTPLFEFDMEGEQPSGEARRRAEGRINKHARKVQRAASRFFVQLGDTVLGVLGTEGTVSATFNPLETSTDKEGIELVSAKVKAGVPVRQALLEAGYTDEQVNLWWPEDSPGVTFDVLTTVAQALAQLGQAQTLGVIEPQEVKAMLPAILTAARGEGPSRAPASLPLTTPSGRPQLTAV